MILAFSCFIIILSMLVGFLLFRNLLDTIVYASLMTILVGPSTKLFGLESPAYSLSLYKYFTLLIFPGLLFYYILFTKFSLSYLSSIIKENRILFIGFIAFVLVNYSRVFVYGVPISEIPYLTYLHIWDFLICLIFYSFVFRNYSVEKSVKMLHYCVLHMLLFASVLSLGTFLHLPPFPFIHEQFYNFFIGGFSLKSTYDFIIQENRVYSIFNWVNQFGCYSSLTFIFGFCLFRAKRIKTSTFSIYVLLSFIPVITSQSRTSIVLLAIASIYLLWKNSNAIFKIVVPLIVVMIGIPLLSTSERISMLLNKEYFIDSLTSMRVIHWINFFDIIVSNKSTIFLGAFNHIEAEVLQIESGVLQFFSQGGIVLTVILIMIMFKIGRTIEEGFNRVNIYKVGKAFVLILIIGEIFQGWLFNFKLSIFVSIIYTVAYTISKKEKIIS